MKRFMFKIRNVAVVTALLVTSFSAVAMPVNNDPEKIEFRYVGKLKSNPIFELNLPNASANSSYTVLVMDASGDILYSEELSAGSKRFLLDDSDLKGSAVSFEITQKNDKKTVKFDVNPHSRTIAQTTVSAVKY